MKAIKISFLILFLISILAIGFLLYKYISWEKSFVQQEEVLCVNDISNGGDDIEEKIKNFILSNEKTESFELTEEEVLFFLNDNIDTAGNLEIRDMCLVSEEGVWTVYIKIKADILNLPWIAMDVVKDERETAELFVDDIYVGDMPLPEFISKSLLLEINKGITDALILVNENSFLGREIQNIELLEQNVVIKGTI